MSKTILITISDSDNNSFTGLLPGSNSVSFWQTLRDPITGNMYSSVGEAYGGEFTKVLLPARLANPSNNTTAAQNNQTAATVTLNNLLYPTLIVGAGFLIGSSNNNVSVAHNNSANLAFNMTFPDPSYSGNVTFSQARLIGTDANTGNYNPASFNFSFTPASLAAPGNANCTVTAANNAIVGSYLFRVIGTDANNMSNTLVASMNVT